MKTLVPQSPLNQFVELIWLMPASDGGQNPELALPTGTVELVIDLDNEQMVGYLDCDPNSKALLYGPIICGVHSRPFLINTKDSGRTVGVHFKAGGAAGILPFSTRETENRQLELEAIAGPLARKMQDLLQGSTEKDEDVLKTVESLLLGLIHRAYSPMIACSVNQLIAANRPDVATLVDQSGLSHRRFNELFRQEVGLTAKKFSRVARFQQALLGIDQHHHVDWADLANECQFSDQAHLIHEFRRHANMTPGMYLSRRTERLNHPEPDLH